MIRDPPVTVEPFQFSPAKPVAYEWSEIMDLDEGRKDTQKPGKADKKTCCR